MLPYIQHKHEKEPVAMNVADEILELLESSGIPLSGEEMARKLGVSRNAVWKAVQRLR